MTPDNTENFYKETFFHFDYIVCYEDISKYLIIYINLMGTIFVLAGNDNTYEIKRAKQVFIYGKKEKRAFIATLFINLGGKVLSIQSI